MWRGAKLEAKDGEIFTFGILNRINYWKVVLKDFESLMGTNGIFEQSLSNWDSSEICNSTLTGLVFQATQLLNSCISTLIVWETNICRHVSSRSTPIIQSGIRRREKTSPSRCRGVMRFVPSTSNTRSPGALWRTSSIIPANGTVVDKYAREKLLTSDSNLLLICTLIKILYYHKISC